jgi:Cu/Zn superoxide dismutase
MPKHSLMIWAMLSVFLLPGMVVGDRPRPYESKEGAVCVLGPTEGSKASGVITLVQHEKHVRIGGVIRGLSPGSYSLSIHEYGDLTSLDGSSTGPRLTISETEESEDDELASFTVKRDNEDGRARIDVKVEGLDLKLVIGRSMVVATGRDEGIAFGVIGIRHPPERAER